MLPCVWSLDSTFWWLDPSDFWTVYRSPSKVFDIPQLTGTDFEILWTLVEFILLMIGLTIIWDALSLILSGMWSSWVYCKTLWSYQRWSRWVSRYAVQTSSVLWAGCWCTVELGVNSLLLVPVYCWTDLQKQRLNASLVDAGVMLFWETQSSLRVGTHLLVYWRNAAPGGTRSLKWRRSSYPVN